MPYTLTGAVLAVALLPAHVLGQVAPPSAPVPAPMRGIGYPAKSSGWRPTDTTPS